MNQRRSADHAEDTIPVCSRRLGSWRITVQRLAFARPDLARRYDRAAAGWGRLLDRLGYPDAYEALLGKVLEQNAPGEAGLTPRVLDCGAGTGALSIAFARVFPEPVRFDAVDISPGMLDRARTAFRAAGVDATLRLADARELPFADHAFDMVMTAHALEHIADPRAALREMTRVLKPGGILFTCVTRRSGPGLLVHLKWRTHRVTPAQCRRLLRAGGLENVRCLSLDGWGLCGRLSVACAGRKPRPPSAGSPAARHPDCAGLTDGAEAGCAG